MRKKSRWLNKMERKKIQEILDLSVKNYYRTIVAGYVIGDKKTLQRDVKKIDKLMDELGF